MRRNDLLRDPDRAWSPFEPTPGEPWDRSRVAHLHRRAGFLASWSVLDRDLKDGLVASVDRLLDGEPRSLDGQEAAEFDALIDQMATTIGASGLSQAQGVWLYRMILTHHPLRERLTLFWHDHFATSNAKVNNPSLMQRQNDLFRRHALGDFGSMLRAIDDDPAMLLWLDSAVSRKARPNENYAREVMELFTIGRGHYAEKDIQEAARAYTGVFVQGGRFSFLESQHDNGEKTILGKTGNFGPDEVARILLDQPSCAEFLCRKLFRLFVSEVDTPSPSLLAPLARQLRESNFEIRVPVATILKSTLFHDRSMRRKRVKSPVELVVGAIRALEIVHPTVSAEALAATCSRMGQSLYAPPSVAGWDGGPSWINTTTTLERSNFALALLSSTDAALGNRLKPAALAEKHGGGADFFVDLLVQDGLEAGVRGKIKGSQEEVARLVMTAPEFQLG